MNLGQSYNANPGSSGLIGSDGEMESHDYKLFQNVNLNKIDSKKLEETKIRKRKIKVCNCLFKFL